MPVGILRKTLLLQIVGVMAGFSGLNAHADIIFDDFGASPVYSWGYGYQFAGSGSLAGVEVDAALPFTSTGDFTLAQIDLALANWHGTNSALITLNTDSGGLPGTDVLMSWNVSNLPPFPTCCPVVTLTATSPVVLAAGTRYWIVGAPVNSTDDSFDVFLANSVGLIGPTAFHPPTGWFIQNNQPEVAFDVLGTPLSSVPEPPTAFLLVTVLTMLGTIKSRLVT